MAHVLLNRNESQDSSFNSGSNSDLYPVVPKSQQSELTTIQPIQTHIDHLPFDCFYHIFDRRIALKTLLPLRRVSSIWNRHILNTCSLKSRLTLNIKFASTFIERFPQDLYWTDNLRQYYYVSNRTESHRRRDYIEFSSPWLVGLIQRPVPFVLDSSFVHMFSSLTELVVRFDCGYYISENIKPVGAILQSFALSAQLRSFQFWLPAHRMSRFEYPKFLLTLYRVFGQNLTQERFPFLVQLDLYISFDLEAEHKPLPADSYRIDFGSTVGGFTILTQLERFSLDCYIEVDHIGPLLRQLGPQLTYISINCQAFATHMPDNLLDGIQFSDSLTHLRLEPVLFPKSNVLQKFFQRFPVLQSVQLKAPETLPPTYFSRYWFTQLNSLKHLTELRLDSLKIEQFNKCSLPSIRKLTLCKDNPKFLFRWFYPEELMAERFCCALASQFPNLEEFVCIAGGRYENDSDKEFELAIRHNLRYLTNLRTSFINITSKEFSITVCNQ